MDPPNQQGDPHCISDTSTPTPDTPVSVIGHPSIFQQEEIDDQQEEIAGLAGYRTSQQILLAQMFWSPLAGLCFHFSRQANLWSLTSLVSALTLIKMSVNFIKNKSRVREILFGGCASLAYTYSSLSGPTNTSINQLSEGSKRSQRQQCFRVTNSRLRSGGTLTVVGLSVELDPKCPQVSLIINRISASNENLTRV